jgi:Tfp pilus assembly protein PilW
MEFRITSSTNHSRAGTTLIEYLVGIGIAGLVMLVIAPLTLYSGRSFAELANYTDLNSKGILALDRLTKEIRQSEGLLSYTTNQLIFTNGPGKANLTYTYVPSQRRLLRTEGTSTRVMLRECDSLQFSIYQRTPKPGTYDQYATASANNCKVVTVRWVCSRRLLGARVNTEEVQTAKVVIRKH